LHLFMGERVWYGLKRTIQKSAKESLKLRLLMSPYLTTLFHRMCSVQALVYFLKTEHIHTLRVYLNLFTHRESIWIYIFIHQRVVLNLFTLWESI
jgi:hypothetical protein